MIYIGTSRTKVPDDAIAIKVDRTSILGNPFVLTNELERDTIIEKYKTYFYSTLVQSNTKARRFYIVLERIKNFSDNIDVYLICHCYPKNCHAQIIKEYIERM